MSDVLRKLRRSFGMKSVLIEGGAHIIQTVLGRNLASQVLYNRNASIVYIYLNNIQVVITIKPSFLGGFRSLISQLSRLETLSKVSTEIVGGDIMLYGQLPAVSETEERAMDLLGQWENYATKSADVYEKLYPKPTRLQNHQKS